ncbi:MAG TPA: carbonic anhydrase [Candidatus Polarisedimenticolaceae bacterium]|nr:carbonic anhydrase [Candidatus Polarisedimenticolaceae bacterium]
MLLDGMLEHNRRYVAGRESRPLPPVETLKLAVVACYDPRLDSLLVQALGLEPDKAFLFRTAGAHVRPNSGSLRSLALAVYLFGVTEVVVCGHTSCRMAQFQASDFIEAFRRRGVAREAFGTDDLREWTGAIPGPGRGVQLSVANIRGAAFLPRDLVVSGVVLDDASGALEVVVQPGEAIPTVEQTATAVHTTPAVETPPAVATVPAVAAPPPDSLADAVEGFARAVHAKVAWRAELERLRGELARSANPVLKFRLLESFARRAGADAKDVAQAFDQVRREVAALRGEVGAERLTRALGRLGGPA